MACKIVATGRAVPARKVTNDDLAKIIDTSDEWIRSHTGIGSRHIADADTAASDLATEAAKKALALMAGIELSDEKGIKEAALTLDMIILATATADHYGSPSTACLVQERIGAFNAGAFDISAACTGFIYGLELAASLLQRGGRQRILVIGTEVLSKFTNWKDRGSCILFGDGAGAAILEGIQGQDTAQEKQGIIRTLLKADGTGAEHIIFRRGGSRSPYLEGETIGLPTHVEINGQAVYNFAVKAMTDTISELLNLEGLKIDDITMIIPHQANARIISAAIKRLKFPEEKCYINIEEYANTSAASIPIALDELNRNGEIKKGDILLTVGFGAGLTYGANLIVW